MGKFYKASAEMRPLRPLSSVREALTLPLQRTQGHHDWKEELFRFDSPATTLSFFLPLFCLSNPSPSLAFWLFIGPAFFSCYLFRLSSLAVWLVGAGTGCTGLVRYVGQSMARSKFSAAACCCPDPGHWPCAPEGAAFQLLLLCRPLQIRTASWRNIWLERCLIVSFFPSLWLSLSLSLPVCLSVCLPVCPTHLSDTGWHSGGIRWMPKWWWRHWPLRPKFRWVRLVILCCYYLKTITFFFTFHLYSLYSTSFHLDSYISQCELTCCAGGNCHAGIWITTALFGEARALTFQWKCSAIDIDWSVIIQRVF